MVASAPALAAQPSPAPAVVPTPATPDAASTTTTNPTAAEESKAATQAKMLAIMQAKQLASGAEPAAVEAPAYIAAAETLLDDVVATAIFPHSQSDDEEITLNVGDRVVVTARDDADWWTGYVQNAPTVVAGQFPAKYLDISNLAQVDHDYDAADDTELSLRIGQQVVVTAKQLDDGNEEWWQGYVYEEDAGEYTQPTDFPSNYVTMEE
jgi:hypothetical protein